MVENVVVDDDDADDDNNSHNKSNIDVDNDGTGIRTQRRVMTHGDTVVSSPCRSCARVKSKISWIMESVSVQSRSWVQAKEAV